MLFTAVLKSLSRYAKMNTGVDIMEDILELIVTILVMPFKSFINKMKYQINKMPNKALKVLLIILFVLIPAVLLFGLVCLCSYIFRGYWI